MADAMKVELAKAIRQLLIQDLANSSLRTEVTEVSPLETQVKVWPERGQPRYFNVKVSEML